MIVSYCDKCKKDKEGLQEAQTLQAVVFEFNKKKYYAELCVICKNRLDVLRLAASAEAAVEFLGIKSEVKLPKVPKTKSIVYTGQSLNS